jgi:glycosyltransferase involved in cell wall biosynthesis
MEDNSSKIKVIVSCSGKFHAFALAEQLERFGMLEKLYTSYSSIKNPFAKFLVSRRDKELIPKSKVSTFLPIAIGLKIIKKPFFWNELFDRWVAYKIKRSNADVFIGWSGMSLNSIQAAKKKGMITILERGSSHIKYQDEILHIEYYFFGLDFRIDPNVLNKELREYSVCNFISVPSNFVRRSFEQKGVPKNKLFVNNYGSSNYFKKLNLSIQKNRKFRILYLGAITIQKGIKYLLQALHLMNVNVEDYEVWFIGSVSKEMKETIDELILENCKFLGHIEHYKLAEYISSCDVAIQPSNQEGLSMVIPQIMSCGVPVIATTNTGGEDLIINGETGFIVAIRDPKAIADNIEFLFNNPDKLKEMKTFLENNPVDLSWNAYGDRYAKFLKSIY